ncbi:gluconokinase [Lacisediminihabitans changchengi]|uniref:gluconokinase n=1 Tax=Lacisediminihabitans changchengi TaxID=2787634 RepID=UPI0027DD1A6C|nr:gluconokinase [Lacisediminihabitans changchengi]
MSSTSPQPLLVVMGVSGSGKSTVGAALAAALDVPFQDADPLHPASNVAKMAAGIALTDDDRMPWLALVGAELSAAAASPGGSGTGLVMACSALKRAYREAILAAAPTARFIYLEGSRELIESRLENRHGHFMPSSLLGSQLATLEPLESDEPGITVELRAGEPPVELVARIVSGITAGDAV